MKKFKRVKNIVLTALVISFPGFFNLSAQDYSAGIGIRGGLAQGITLKFFTGRTNNAIEGILAVRWSGTFITGLYEIHDDPFRLDGMQWFYGFGAHIGFWDGGDVPWEDEAKSITAIGVDGIIGLEYTFEEIPINVSLDWKPAVNLVGGGYWTDGFAISVRYVF
jgi:hypothetical protein